MFPTPMLQNKSKTSKNNDELNKVNLGANFHLLQKTLIMGICNMSMVDNIKAKGVRNNKTI